MYIFLKNSGAAIARDSSSSLRYIVRLLITLKLTFAPPRRSHAVVKPAFYVGKVSFSFIGSHCCPKNEPPLHDEGQPICHSSDTVVLSYSIARIQAR